LTQFASEAFFFGGLAFSFLEYISFYAFSFMEMALRENRKRPSYTSTFQLRLFVNKWVWLNFLNPFWSLCHFSNGFFPLRRS
jgi:hypothetical protein